jgi:hypothetical protein
MDRDALVAQLVELLDGVGAHMPFEAAVADFPDEAMNRRPPNVHYTPWQLLEHLRLTQADILEYCTSREYVEKPWPEGLWPEPGSEATPEQFTATIAAFLADRDALKALVTDPTSDLFAVIPETPGHTLLREVRVVADHNAYHVGEFAILRQVMGTWARGPLRLKAGQPAPWRGPATRSAYSGWRSR